LNEARSDSWIRLKRRIFPRGLSFTREGKIYTGVTLGVGFAAVNTSNNLLFLVLGLMLGLIIVSGILSEMTLRKIKIHRRMPKRVEADLPFAVELTLSNEKRTIASFSVELRDEIEGKPFRRRCYFLRVGPGEGQSISYKCELPRRGQTVFNGTLVTTRFPFGLFEKKRFIALEDSIIVLPGRLPVVTPSRLGTNSFDGASINLLGPGTEFRELREMTLGDDPRKIHWRSSARLGRLLIRENEAEVRGQIEIVLDTLHNGSGGELNPEAEQNIKAAGTIIRDATDQGFSVRLVTCPPAAMEATNKREAVALLEHLALIDTGEAGSYAGPTGRAAGAVLLGPRSKTVGRGYRLRLPTGASVADAR